MFGFLKPASGDWEYHRVYVRCCQHQRLHYRLRSLPFHSYGAVFLYLSCLDAGTIHDAILPRRTTCRMGPDRTLLHAEDAWVGQFCASFSLLLASIKLEDDLRDGGGMGPQLCQAILRRRLRKAYDYFAAIDRQFAERIDQFVQEHLTLEAAGRRSSLPDYAGPTAAAFGYVFGLLASLPGMGRHGGALDEIGREIGSATLCHDCAVDWREDARRGRRGRVLSPLLPSRFGVLVLHRRKVRDCLQ